MTSTKEALVQNDEPYVGPPHHPLQTADVWVQNTSPDAPWLMCVLLYFPRVGSC